MIMRPSIAFCVGICGTWLATPSASLSIEPCEVDRLTGDPAGLGCFGAGLAISGDYIVAGDPCDDTRGSWAGAAYVFRREPGLQSWARQQKIFGSDIIFQDNFGQSVAIEGDRLVVGAPHFDVDGEGFGFAYVFQRSGNTWVQTQKLVSSGSALEDGFGGSVSMSGDWIAVGAPGQANYHGRVVLFRWNGNNYVEDATLAGSDTVQWDGFGGAVGIRQDRLLVGAPSADQEQGKVYVFRRQGNTWVEEAMLSPSDGMPQDFFGVDISLDNDRAIVGAQGTDQGGPSAGSAYIFIRNGTVWTEQTNLRASSPQGAAGFGSAVAISGTLALVGEHHRHVTGTDNIGRGYLFQYDGGIWTESASFAPQETSPGLVFGNGMAFDGAYAVIGSSSAAHVFAVPGPCIPAIGGIGLLIMAGGLMAASVVLIRRNNKV